MQKEVFMRMGDILDELRKISNRLDAAIKTGNQTKEIESSDSIENQKKLFLEMISVYVCEIGKHKEDYIGSIRDGERYGYYVTLEKIREIMKQNSSELRLPITLHESPVDLAVFTFSEDFSFTIKSENGNFKYAKCGIFITPPGLLTARKLASRYIEVGEKFSVYDSLKLNRY